MLKMKKYMPKCQFLCDTMLGIMTYLLFLSSAMRCPVMQGVTERRVGMTEISPVNAGHDTKN